MTVTTYYLETNSPLELKGKPNTFGLEVRKCGLKLFQFNRFLYRLVGEQWRWEDKSGWSEQQWRDYAEDPALHTWVAYLGGTPVGYFELQQQGSGHVEIAYFGLIPQCIGRGYGGFLLSEAIRCAWALGAVNVWVHTCTLDHPSALKNYEARGMRIFKTETKG